MKIAINGAGIAGPCLAWWLAGHGHEPVLIEKAPAPRSGGYIIDFWGLGYDIAERMGLIPAILERGYQVGEVRFVDSQGRANGGFATDVFTRMTDGRFTSLRRSDLAGVLLDAANDRAETLFGDSVAALEDDGGRVGVTFEHAAPREFDLVVGCDGLHSKVRELAFGPEKRFEADLGYRVAAFEVEGYRPRDELVYVSYTRPGRQISRFSMRDDCTLFLFVFRTDVSPGPFPETDEGQKAVLREVFAGAGWETEAILDLLDGADLYFDRVSQIRMDHWTKGRVALAGDAAACVSLLAGEGTGLAIAEAYVLAGEFARASSDHEAAFSAYEERLMPFLQSKQKSARRFASSFAPKSELGISIRNLATKLARVPLFADWLIGGDLRDDIRLPDYANR
ncbi:MAG: FAD-binding domain [Rhizobiaceae bacterium]|nr:FAD-binding domain [Rhizobiaceae bacterium]